MPEWPHEHNKMGKGVTLLKEEVTALRVMLMGSTRGLFYCKSDNKSGKEKMN
jgi:hypothetical protein